MKVIMTNRELVDLFDAMKQIGDTEKQDKWFTYALILNEENLKSKVTAVLECGKPKDKFREYEDIHQELIKRYADRDEDDNVVVDNTSHMIKIKPAFVEEARSQFNALDEKFVDILDERIQDLKKFKEILDAEVVVDIEQVSLKCFPEDMNKLMLRALKPLIKVECN